MGGDGIDVGVLGEVVGTGEVMEGMHMEKEVC